MLRKGVPDIRLLRSTDPRVAGQMGDLAPYRPVSNLPAVTRDLSVAVPQADQAEDLGDRVRDSLGAGAESLEAVTVVSETGATGGQVGTSVEDPAAVARRLRGLTTGRRS